MAISISQSRVKTLLKLYSIGIFVFIISVPILLLLVGKFQVESAQGTPCSGNYGSGQECTGNPGANRVWSCLRDTSSYTGYSCQSTGYQGCTYDTPGGPLPCNCQGAIDHCQSECRNAYANQPGYHTYSRDDIRCSGCGQVVGCDCNIDQPPPPAQCPYSNVVIRFQKDITDPWKSSSDFNFNCGDSFRIGALESPSGSQIGGDGELIVNGQVQGSTIVTKNSQTPGPQTFNVQVRIKKPDGGYYPESECNATASVTCTPINVDSCPYNRVAIQFSENGIGWANNISITCGEALYARVVNTQTGLVMGSDTRLFLNGNKLPSNNHSLYSTTPGPVTYRFKADVLNQSGIPYTEAKCNDHKEVTCEPIEVPKECNSACSSNSDCPSQYSCYENKCRDMKWPDESDCKPEHEITKSVIAGNNGLVNSIVTYRVVLKNTSGNTTFNSVAFVDTYNPSQLKFANPVTGYSPQFPSGKQFNLAGSLGNVSHSNLASVLGPIDPGQEYTLMMNFQATASGNGICNEAGWNPNNFGWKYSEACLGINIEIPDTDL